MRNGIDQRTIKITLFKRQDGWRKYQIKALEKTFGIGKVQTNYLYPEDILILGEIEKYQIMMITGETNFTAHRIIGYDNPRIQWNFAFK